MNRFEKIVSDLARKSCQKYKVGAIVLLKGKIIGKGFNSRKSHPLLKNMYGFCSMHAECSALLKTDTKGDTIIVFRIKKDGFGCSKPCHRCQRFIKDNGIKKVIYTNNAGVLETMYL